MHEARSESKSGMQKIAGIALECVGSHVPDSNTDKAWITRRRLVQHAARCWSFIFDDKADEDGRTWALHSLGTLHSGIGMFDEAEKMYKRAL
jgi:hypothetical protein